MQANKSKDTKPELILRKSLRDVGLGGYRLHWNIPGKPDICYPGRRIAIFVNGCFWHRCPKCNPPMPHTRIEYWEEKFRKNRERDSRNIKKLEDEGWTVIVVWECEIKNDLQMVTVRIRTIIGGINVRV